MGNIDLNQHFAQLMDQYGSLVYSICYKTINNRFDAQDLTQETFLSVYKNLPSFDGENARAWICKIATNKCLDYLKSSGLRSLPTEESYFQGIESRGPTPESALLAKDEREQILALCKTLKPPYDEIAANYFYNEMTATEIAKKSGKKLKTVQTQIRRARHLLKNQWRKETASWKTNT